MNLTPEAMLEALGWLADLPSAPSTDPRTPDGKRWLARLGLELADVHPSPDELVETCRAMARVKDARHPTPGQVATAVVERRRSRAQTSDWSKLNHEVPVLEGPAPAGLYPPNGWAEGRDQRVVLAYVQDLVDRGHGGFPDTGEGYVVAMLREEREAAEARARGERYMRPRYGPSLVGGGTIGRALGGALAARKTR